MTDTPPKMRDDSRASVPAIVTYWLLAIWSGIVASVIGLVAHGVMIDGILLALLSGIIGTETTLLVSSVSFWVGATVGGKAANERLAEASKVSNAALAQLAGAGAPPPADPNALPVAAETVA